MIVRPTLGIIRKNMILGNRFSMSILERYRLTGTYFYQGVSFTYLKAAKGSPMSPAAENPVYMALKLILQETYWQNQITMVQNRQVIQQAIRMRLSQVMDRVRAEYREIWPQLERLRTWTLQADAAEESPEICRLLSIQLKQLGEGSHVLTGTERDFLRQLHERFRSGEEVRISYPVLWERYLERSRTEEGDPLLLFLNLFQNAAQEERLEFQDYLTEQEEQLLERDPGRLLAVLKEKTFFRLGRISAEYTRTLTERMAERFAYELPTQQDLTALRRELIYRTAEQASEEEREEMLSYLQRDPALPEGERKTESLKRLTDSQVEALHTFLTEYAAGSQTAETGGRAQEADAPGEDPGTDLPKAAGEPESGWLEAAESLYPDLERVSAEYTYLLQERMAERFAYELPTQQDLTALRRELIYRTAEQASEKEREELLSYLQRDPALPEGERKAESLKRLTGSQAEALHTFLTEYAAGSQTADADRWAQEADVRRERALEDAAGRSGEKREDVSDRQSLRHIWEIVTGRIWEHTQESLPGPAGERLGEILAERSFRNLSGRVPAAIETNLAGFHETRMLRSAILTYALGRPEAEQREILEKLTETVSPARRRTERTEDKQIPAREALSLALGKADAGNLRRVLETLSPEVLAESRSRTAVQAVRMPAALGRFPALKYMQAGPKAWEEILEKPYALTHTRKQLLEAVQRGSETELSRLMTYMTFRQMAGRREQIQIQYPQEMRELLYRRIRQLTAEQIEDLSENILQDILASQEYRQLEREEREERLYRRMVQERETDLSGGVPARVQRNTLSSGTVWEQLPAASPMVYREMSGQEEEQTGFRETLVRHVEEEQTETRQLRYRQERTVQILSDQTEELEQMKEQLKKQSRIVEELKSTSVTSVQDRNQLYREIMGKMEQRLRLERQRRGLD